MEEHNNNSGRPPGGGDDNKNPRNRQSLLMFMIVAFAALMFWTLVGNRGNPRQEITYNEFLQMLADKGARFGFYFHYMPVGNKAVPELMPTSEQRKYIIERLRYIRSDQCNIPFFPMDFQNDGEPVGGCIAGGGQPYGTEDEIRAKRINGLYTDDKKCEFRKSHQNPDIQKIYKDFFGEPSSHKAHKLLHTHYVSRPTYKK